MTLVTLVVYPKVSVHASTTMQSTILVNPSVTPVNPGKIGAGTQLVPGGHTSKQTNKQTKQGWSPVIFHFHIHSWSCNVSSVAVCIVATYQIHKF